MQANHFLKHIYVKKPVEYSVTMTNTRFVSAVLLVGGLPGKTKLRKNILMPRERGFFFFFSFLKSQRAKCARTRQMVGKNRKDLFTFPPLFGWRGIH